MDNMTDQARDVVGLDIASTTTLLNPEESINATYKNVTDNYLYHGTPAVVTMSILIVISMILALGGNIMVIITIARHRGMRTRTNLLLANLAVADILVAVLDMPFALITIIKGKWIFSQNFCYFNGFTVGLGLMLSVQTLMWISIHKFISITRPFSRTVTPGKIVLMMLAAWGWTILFNLTPTPVLAPLNLQLTNTVYKKGASQCGPPVPTNSRQLIHSALNTIFNLVIPFIVMIYCYYRIFKEVRTHLNRMKDFADTSRWNTINQQRRITETLCIVLLIFFLFWMPYIIYSLTLVAKKSINPVLNPISYMFGYMNSACNPIIYALRSPTFRRGFKEIICRGDQGPAHSLSGASVPRSRSTIRQTISVMGSHEEGEPISQFGGIVMSFRRSIWRSQRKATRRKSRNRQHSNQRRPAIESRSINGAKQVPESSAVHQGTPTPYSPVTDVLLVTTDSEQKSNGDPEKIDIAREEELEGNNALDTLESGQTYELTQITPTSQIIASDPMSDSSCSFVLSNSSPFIFGDTDSDDDYVQNSIPLINCKSASDSGSLDPEFEINSMCRHASCDCVLEGNSNIKDPEFSPVVSNAFTPYQNLGKQKKYSHSNCDILSTTKLQHDQKSKSVGDFTRVRNDSGSTKTIDAPKEHVRNVPFTLQWQASVDNLYGSPRLPRRKLRYHMRREEIRRGLTYDARDDSSIPGGRKKINPLSTGGHTQLRVAAIINNMKRSFSDLLHGDDTDRTHTGYSTSTFYDPSHSDDRTEC